jgi:signal transduction histidine kinase
VPERYAGLPGITTLTCTPVSAGGRWLGVIFADRGGGHFELNEDERHAMWTLGKTAALAATVRIATSQQGRARLLEARIELAREIHERVVQRLFGVSLVLGAESGLSEEARRRCADEMQAALKDLRDALGRPLAPPSLDTGAKLRDELARLGRHYKDLPLELSWEEGVEVPPAVEPLAQSVLAEALRNVDKHAQPSSVRVRVGRVDGTFVLEVRNDGARGGTRGAGMGLRLAAVEALGRGALVEFGPEGSEWRVRLVVPVEEGWDQP